MVDMAKLVCEACEAAQSGSEAVSGKRPADIYRTFAEALRWINKNELFPKANRLMRELSLEQSLPIAELDAPEWVDAYTGEVDMSMADRINIKPLEKELDEFEGAALASSEGFDADDELENIYHDADFTQVGEWDVRDPMWMIIQNDMKPSDDINELKADPDLRKARKIMKAEYKRTIAFGLCKEAATEMVHHAFYSPIMLRDQNTGELTPGRTPAEMVLDRLNTLAQSREVKDIAYLFLSFQNEFGFNEEDAALIKVQGSLPTLEDWLEIFGDEVLESLNSTFDPEMTWAQIEAQDESEHALVVRFADDTIKNIVAQADADAKQLKANDPHAKVNVFQHPAFVEAFLRSMSMGSSTVYKDTDGKWHNAAQKAGWCAWMEQFNPTAYKAYQAAIKAGKSFDQSKSSFWQATKSTKRLEAIRGILKSGKGLVLASGREINWAIAALKYKANELVYAEGQKERLAALLLSKGLIQAPVAG